MATTINRFNRAFEVAPGISNQGMFPQQSPISSPFHQMAEMVAMLSQLLQATRGMANTWGTMAGPANPVEAASSNSGQESVPGTDVVTALKGSAQAGPQFVAGDAGTDVVAALKGSAQAEPQFVAGDAGSDVVAALKGSAQAGPQFVAGA